MQYSCGIQISDLEAIQSDFEQQLTTGEAEKVVSGYYWSFGVDYSLLALQIKLPLHPCKI
jgi:hypothetical protein